MMKRIKGFLIIASCLFVLINAQTAYAQCWPSECGPGQSKVTEMHQKFMDDIINNDPRSFVNQLKDLQDWFVPDPAVVPVTNEGFIFGHVIRAMRLMTRQLSVFAMHQTLIAGTFFDAQQQLETQRTFQLLKSEAHRDYHPSEDFCWFGTNVRGMAASESRGRFQSLALNTYSMNRQLGTLGTASTKNKDSDKIARWEKFKTTYCDPQDNNWNGKKGSGLELACLDEETGNIGGGETDRLNLDIDYSRLIDQRRTLDIAFDNEDGIDDGAGNFSPPPDREDVIALASNLYGHDVLRRDFGTDLSIDDTVLVNAFMDLRSVAARRNVAENSFNAMVEMKSSGGIDADNPSSAREFLGAVLVELGIPSEDVFQYIGENPSYYAQLEILAKKIYQTPDFYANLYDKPANVERKSVALRAIELMLDRAIYESQLRREMATSVLLSTKLRKELPQKLQNDIKRIGG